MVVSLVEWVMLLASVVLLMVAKIVELDDCIASWLFFDDLLLDDLLTLLFFPDLPLPRRRVLPFNLRFVLAATTVSFIIMNQRMQRLLQSILSNICVCVCVCVVLRC